MRKSLFTLFFIFVAVFVFAEKIYIFYPTIERPKNINKKLAKHFPDADIVVFGKYIDFVSQVEREKPELVISKSLILSDLKDYEIEVKGKGSSSEDETCLLISLKPLELSAEPGLSLGVVNSLGRARMKDVISQNIEQETSLKFVNKIEDLYPFLMFGMTDAVLLARRNFNYFKNFSNTNLYSKEIENFKVDSIGVARLKDAEINVWDNFISNLPEEFMRSIGVVNWAK